MTDTTPTGPRPGDHPHAAEVALEHLRLGEWVEDLHAEAPDGDRA